MKKGKFRRAFTLVELVVVIAVVAILSAVAVGAYFGVINSANESNFNVALAECNKILQANEILDGKNKTLSEARLDLIENGFNFDDFKFELNDSFFVWDSTTDRFEIKKKSDTVNRSLDQFVVISSDDELVTYKGYSYYLTSDYNAIISINWLAGIDAGKATIPDVKDSSGNITTYGINISSGDPTEDGHHIILNGNGSTSFYVNAPNAEFNEYGTVSGMMVTCAKNSLHLFGSSYGNLIIKGQGRVVFEEGSSFIGTVYAIADKSSESSEITDITVEYNGGNYPAEIISNVETKTDSKESNSAKVEIKGFEEKKDSVNSNVSDEFEYTAPDINSEETKTDASKNNVAGNYSFYYTYGNESIEEITTKDELTEALKNRSSGYLFASGVLDFDLNIPSGITLVVDYLDPDAKIGSSIIKLDDSTGQVERSDSEHKLLRVGSGDAICNGGNYDFSSKFGNCLKSFTINSGVTLTFEDNANLVVEGKILEPDINNYKKFEIGDYAEIINNGTIILGSSSNLFALGKITGAGEIITSNSSKVYEPFKYTDSRDKLSAGVINLSEYQTNGSFIFPFWNYYIDNIECKTLFIGGSEYKLIGTAMNFALSIRLIGSETNKNDAIFILNNTSRIQKSATSGKMTMNFLQGSINDGYATLNVAGYIKGPTSIFTFPLTNMDIIINKSAVVSLNTYEESINVLDSTLYKVSTNYLMLPTSRLINYGTLNLGANNHFGFISCQDAAYIASDDYCISSDNTFEKAFWNSFSGNKTFLSSFINYGNVNVNTTSEDDTGGIYKMLQSVNGNYQTNEKSEVTVSREWSIGIFDLTKAPYFERLFFKKYL